MDESNSKPEKPKIKRDLVELTEDSSQKINQWIAQINAKKPVSLSRKAFLNWFIANAEVILSSSEISSAIETFYDAETHIRQILRDIQKSKNDGVSTGFDIVLKPKRLDPKKEIDQETPEETFKP